MTQKEREALIERLAAVIFEAAKNPINWRFADHQKFYAPLARAALEEADLLQAPITVTSSNALRLAEALYRTACAPREVTGFSDDSARVYLTLGRAALEEISASKITVGIGATTQHGGGARHGAQDRAASSLAGSESRRSETEQNKSSMAAAGPSCVEN
jgi:hypothetical protein